MARRAIQVVAVTGFQAAVLFLSAGTLHWPSAWAYLGLYAAGIVANAALLLRFSPQTVAERASTEGMRDWDKVVGGLFGIVFFVGIPLVAGLDYHFAWTSMGVALHLLGGAVFALGFALFSWSMVANTHFATVVRLAEERKHTVCDHGPYRYVRHPGYVGGILQSLALPLLLGSWWAAVGGALAALLLVVRTALEDRDLRRELAGYAEYATRVGYRLVPGVW